MKWNDSGTKFGSHSKTFTEVDPSEILKNYRFEKK
jgi:hypothetical protein